MEKINNTQTNETDAYRNAHILSEVSKLLQSIGSDMEKSVSLFDSIGEKNELFKKFEKSMNSSPLESFFKMNKISSNQITEFILIYFFTTLKEIHDKINFLRIGTVSDYEIIFFISTEDEKVKDTLYENEFQYSMSDLSDFLSVSFCFINKDMEQDLSNTQKIDF